MSIKIKSKYEKSKKVVLDNLGELSRTKQSFKDEVNINKIIEKYNKTGQFPQLLNSNPKYGDFSTALSYQESLNTIMLANEQFNALSSKVRKKFNNDPVELLKFVSDAKNLEEMYDLGLAVKPAPKDESDVIVGKASKASKTAKGGNSPASGTEANTQE